MESSFSLVDIVAVILVIAGVIHGFRQGVSPSFTLFCGSLIGLFCGVMAYPALARFINSSGEVNETLLDFCSLMGSVFVFFLTLMLIRYVLAQFARFATTLILDRIGGAFAGFVQTVTIIILLFIALTSIEQPLLQKTFGQESAIGRPLVIIKNRLGNALESDYARAHNRMLQQREQRSDQRTQPR
jgi:uncharacterized membrane protein required for colicin V production